MRHNLVLGITVIVLAQATSAFAGVVVSSTLTKLDTKQADPTTVYADTDRLKVVTPENTTIFRGDLNRLWIIDEQRHSYMEMTPETMQRLGGQMAGVSAQAGAANAQMNAAMAQMQAQMAQMPPEQRAMMEQMMASRGLGGPGGPGARAAAPSAPPQVAYSKFGGGKRVAAWSCDIFRKTVNGEQEEELCITPISAAGLTTGDFQVLDKFASFIAPMSSSPMMPRSDYMNWAAMNKAIGFQGMPVDTIVYSQGKPTTQQTVSKIERTGIPASTFDLPPGYTKREMGVPPR
jgi:hypothetical protein